MLKIKLSRIGKKKQPYFRVIVTPDRCKVNGRNLEILGTYNPMSDPVLKINKEKYLFWVARGAKPTLTIQNLVKKVL
jgi:small subunit ribosomal protein S16